MALVEHDGLGGRSEPASVQRAEAADLHASVGRRLVAGRDDAARYAVRAEPSSRVGDQAVEVRGKHDAPGQLGDERSGRVRLAAACAELHQHGAMTCPRVVHAVDERALVGAEVHGCPAR